MLDWEKIWRDLADLGLLALFTVTVIAAVLIATGRMP